MENPKTQWLYHELPTCKDQITDYVLRITIFKFLDEEQTYGGQ
jgi:hypothetical protein